MHPKDFHPYKKAKYCRSVNNYKHLKHLALADNNFNTMMSIDILVGIDFYYSIITGKIVRDSDTPVAIDHGQIL